MMPRVAFYLMVCCGLILAMGLAGCSGRSLQSTDVNREASLPLVESVRRTRHTGADALVDMSQTPERHMVFESALKALIAGEVELARAAARKAGYGIQRIEQAGQDYLMMQETRHPVIGPTVFLAMAPTRDLILSAPHPVRDRFTNLESAIALTRLGARVLIMAGASRCAAQRHSSCSGRTSICGSRERYRVSDVAHNPDTFFHLAHTILTQAWPQSVVVQLHGFSRRDTRAWVVLSDGSYAQRPQTSALTEQVRDRIRVRLGADNTAVSCQDPSDKRFSFRPLCARTNVQGRLLNVSPDVCGQSTQTASGRFLHIEQSWEIRQPFETHWHEIDRYPKALAVIDALADIVPCSVAPCDARTSHR